MDLIDRALHERRTRLSEHEAKKLLHSRDIPINEEVEVASIQELSEAFQSIGFPMVLKACSPDLVHKTERRLVYVDLRNEQEVYTAFDKLWQAIQETGGPGSVLAGEYIRGDRELMVGLTRDEQFGPCVAFGLGGIFTEILHDVAFRLAPLTREDALEMMQEIRGYKILEGIRGLPEADREQLAEILVRVGQLGIEEERIREVDLNPVILDGADPVVVDAAVILQE